MTSVRIAGDRNAPRLPVGSGAAGRQDRDAGAAANTTVPTKRTAPAAARAAAVEMAVARPMAKSGPQIQVSSIAVASSA
jgi:hypothetical protein